MKKIFVITVLLVAATKSVAEETYTWSVVPQFAGIVVHRDWTPFCAPLKKILDIILP